MATVSVFDVANYILRKLGTTSAMKLQKLVYYAQAWSLVWDEKPLFREKIKAWANGPVVPQLYQAHKGQFAVKHNDLHGDPDNLAGYQKDTIDAVLNFYGEKTAQWLSDLTHRERPWRDARMGIPEGERGNTEITHAALADYYGNIQKTK